MPEAAPSALSRWFTGGWRAPLHVHIAAVFLAVLGLLFLIFGSAAAYRSTVLVDQAVSAVFGGAADRALDGLLRLEMQASATAEALAADPIANGMPAGGAEDLRPLALALQMASGISAAYVGYPNGDFLLLRPIGAQAVRLAAPPETAWMVQRIDQGRQRFEFLDRYFATIERRDHIDYPFDPRSRPWFEEARTDRTIVTAPYIFFTTLEPGVTAARRAPGGGVAGVDVSLWDLSARLPAARVEAGAEAAVLDAAGRVLAYSDPARLERIVSVRSLDATAQGADALPAATELGSSILPELAARVRTGDRAFAGTSEIGGRRWHLRAAPLAGRGITFVMAAPADVLVPDATTIRARLMMVLGLAMLPGGLAAWFVARRLARPVEAFAGKVEAVARLDFTERPPLPTRVAELAELDRAFATMRMTLRSFTAAAQGVLEEDEPRRLVEVALSAVMEVAQAERGAAWLRGGGEDLDGPVAVLGVGGGGPTASAALGARIAAASEPIVLRMEGDDPELGPLAGGPGLVSVLGVPLPTGRRGIAGVLALLRPDPAGTGFPAATLAVVQAIARPAALAIDRCRLLEAQRRSLEQLRLLENAVSRLNDIVIITEAEPVDAPDGPRIVYVNDAFVTRTGFSRAEAIGATPRILQGSGTQRVELDRISAALHRWQPVRAELLNYTRDGEEVWLELDIVPIADERGWFTHWVAVERDVTERKRAEEAARLGQERFRLVAQATNDVIWDWDIATGRIWRNDSFAGQFGLAPELDEGGIEARLARVHPDDRERVRARVCRAIEGAADTWSDEYRFARADGTYRVVVDHGSVIRAADGAAIRMVGSMSDVTERREFEERLRQSQKLEAVGQLTGGVAHDFNNLLTVIIGNSEVLVDGLAEQPALRQLAQMTATAGERAAELTQRLLAFARRQALEPRAVDLVRLVDGMQGLLRRTLHADIEIRVEAPETVPPALVDPGQLEVALLNLALNARDAMPDGGTLTLVLREGEGAEADFVEIAVRDTGTGMSPEVSARAFDPFFTTKEVGKGSGLGLSMVYGFVLQSHGHARIDTELGRGTVVRMFLPRAAAVAVVGTPERPHGGAVRGSEHVLVVEDDPLVRQHVMGQLRDLGYAVTAVGSAPEALAVLAGAAAVDLLFTDVVMPGGMDGRQLAIEARRLRPELPVLLTSGYAETEVIDGARRDDQPLLVKPYRRELLAATVRRLLDGG